MENATSFKLKKVFIFAGCLFLLILIVPFIPFSSEHPGPKTRVVYVTHNPVHTALMFPYSSDWAVFPEGKFIEFSWGDVDFFVNVPTWDKLTLPLVFHAMVTPDEGLMHVDVINDVGVPSYKLMVTEEQYQELKKFIWDSFKLKDGKPILYPGHSYYGTDNFYQSTVKYHAFNTCNNWTREGLSRAGVRTSLWTPHKWGVLFHLE